MISRTYPPAGVRSEERLYSLTFGLYNQTDAWADVRSCSWLDLSALLTTHEIGPKAGTCIVPAVFRGTRRHHLDARQIDVVLLDSDSGATLDEIMSAITLAGYAAAISSTHSHMMTETTVKRVGWDKFKAGTDGENRSAETYLTADKGYLQRVAAGAHVIRETSGEVTFRHQPCAKFRVAIPMARPWIADEYENQQRANAVWKELVGALAHALDLRHDQSCTDTSRLFYLPRTPPNGVPPETAILEGAACDIFALPAVPQPEQEPGRRRASKRGGLREYPIAFTDRDTGQVFELRDWGQTYAKRFELVAALQARRPEVFIGRAIDGKHHLRCVNASAHSDSDADAATFAMNASQSEKGSFVHHCRHAHCDEREHLVFLAQMLEEGWLSIEDLHNPAFLRDAPPGPPTIRYVGGGLPEEVDAAEQALIAADLGLYQRGALIVRAGSIAVSVGDERTARSHRIVEVDACGLVEELTRAALWTKYDKRSETWVRINAPMAIANTYLARAGRWKLPVLAGIIDAPTLRADGSILSLPGYDTATGLLLVPRGAALPVIPEHPTKADAKAALGVLKGLIEHFKFVGGVDESVALSSILTATIRPSLSTAPLHGFTAPTAGSGKSLLVDVATMIATGRPAAVIAQGKTEEELEKRLGALLLSGETVIAIDNCEAPLGGEFLCQVLTQGRVRPRILGRSEVPELPSNAMVTATGNNLTLTGDMTRRALLCQLDPDCERPELLIYATKPFDLVTEDRWKYLVAALTVLRAYHVAGRPTPPPPLGSFADWSNWVRGALIWLGEADPVASMETIRGADPKLEALSSVMTQWDAALGSRRVAVRDVIASATEQRTLTGSIYPKQEFIRPDFREALLIIAGENGVVNSRRLGNWLATQESRVIAGKRFARQGVLTGSLTWALDDQQKGACNAA
jgi:hypothetical protein